jgi:hypothetical protein
MYNEINCVGIVLKISVNRPPLCPLIFLGGNSLKFETWLQLFSVYIGDSGFALLNPSGPTTQQLEAENFGR